MKTLFNIPFLSPASKQQLATICPDCPSLLPLHDPKGLESVKAAIEEFNVKSEHDSYFKLMEVGRLTSQVGWLGMIIT